MNSSLLLLVIAQVLCIIVSAYPSVVLLSSEPRPAISKRAFDRVDISPFDFGALAKRYYEYDDDYDFRAKRGGVAKRPFDRLDMAPFGFGTRGKRPFDRLDNSPLAGMLV